MLPNDAQERKEHPVATGVLDYFPLALMAVAHCSKVGNDQHNPGQPLHWAKGKSTDHADCLIRHLMERGTIDSDGVSHTAKVAWRALALLQTELEELDESTQTNPIGVPGSLQGETRTEIQGTGTSQSVHGGCDDPRKNDNAAP